MLDNQLINTKVFIRIFPTTKNCWKYVKVHSNKKNIFVRRLQDFAKGNERNEPLYWKFITDGVFYNMLQQDIYEKVVPFSILNSIFEGHSAIFFAYGSTGSGKSLTLSGLVNTYDDRGIAPRLLYSLFDMKENLNSQFQCAIKMSYVETKNNHLVDLLSEDNTMYTMNSTLNVSQIIVSDRESALKLLFKAEGRKEFVKRCPYYSNVGNAVLSFHVHVKTVNSSDVKVTVSHVHLVDLSGVDTVGNLNCFYKDVKDIGSADTCKSQLEQFLVVLIENIPETVKVKYRLNILVHYLRDVLKNTTLMRFIGHVRLSKEDLMLTISMLRFAQIVRNVKYQATTPLTRMINGEFDTHMLKTEIKNLYKENYLNNIFLNKEVHRELTDKQVQCLKTLVDEYVKDKLTVLELVHFSDVQTVMKYLKDMCNNLEAEKAVCEKVAYNKAMDDFIANAYTDETKKHAITKNVPSKAIKTRKSDRGSGNLLPIKKSSDSKSTISKQSIRLSEKRSSTRPSSKLTNKKSSLVLKEEIESAKDEALPDTIPEYDEAYKLFKEDSKFQYSYFMDLVSAAEEELKEVNNEYLSEVRHLHEMQDSFNKSKERQFMVELHNELDFLPAISINVDLNGEQANILAQQESVLASQALLKLHLKHFNELKQNLNEEFDRFCATKFQTRLTDISKMTEESLEVLDKIINYTEVTPVKDNCEIVKYKKLQSSLIAQIERRRNMKEDDRKRSHMIL